MVGFGVSSSVRLSGVGVWRRPLASLSAGHNKDGYVLFYPLGFYLQSFQDNYFRMAYHLIFTFVRSCNLIFN
jgi:hypothetical protein